MLIFKKKQKRLALAILMGLSIASTSLVANPTNAYAAEQLGYNIPITAEFKDTTIVDTLDALSRLSGIPIVVNGTLTDKVTINSDGQPLSVIINNIAQAFDLSYSERDGMIVISTKENVSNKITKSFKLNYMDLYEAKADITTFIDSDKISVSTIDNSITVTGNASAISNVESLLKTKDVKQKQVTLQVKFVELNKSDETKFGANFVNGHFGELKKGTPWSFVYDAQMVANGTDNTGKTIARPTVSTINGKEATINLADRVPILTTTTSNNDTTTTVDYQDVGVILKVTPRINEDTGYVTMSLNPSVSTITGRVQNNNVSAPQISTRSVTTNLRCKSGQTIILGGLLKKDDIQSISKIPFLGDLPILGKIFQYKDHTNDETELVVMVTPIVEGDENNTLVAHYLNEEKNTASIHNDGTMNHINQTDRRGNDNTKTKRI